VAPAPATTGGCSKRAGRPQRPRRPVTNSQAPEQGPATPPAMGNSAASQRQARSIINSDHSPCVIQPPRDGPSVTDVAAQRRPSTARTTSGITSSALPCSLVTGDWYERLLATAKTLDRYTKWAAATEGCLKTTATKTTRGWCRWPCALRQTNVLSTGEAQGSTLQEEQRGTGRAPRLTSHTPMSDGLNASSGPRRRDRPQRSSSGSKRSSSQFKQVNGGTGGQGGGRLGARLAPHASG